MLFNQSISTSLLFLGCLFLSAVLDGDYRGLVSADELLQLFNTVSECTNGPDDLSDAHQRSIPRTCIDVPDGSDESMTTFVERCFYSYVPDSCYADAENTMIPLVMDVHAATTCPAVAALYTGWMEKAEEECIIIVWPIGREVLSRGCFSMPGFLQSKDIDLEGDNDVTTMPCCCLDGANLPSPSEDDDRLFLKMVIDSVVESFENNMDDVLSIDTDRIYMAGHSNGCMLSLATAALYPDTVAAVCCHAGSVITPFPKDTSTPVPIWLTHGMMDKTVPYNGATLITLPGIGPLGFLSVDQSMEYLANQNECLEEEEIEVLDESGIVVGTHFKRTKCKQGAGVELVALFTAGHLPFKLRPEYSASGGVSTDTTAMAWEFCSSHSKTVVASEVPSEIEAAGELSSENETSNEGEEELAGVEEPEDKSGDQDSVPVDSPSPESSAPTQTLCMALALFAGAVVAMQ